MREHQETEKRPAFIKTFIMSGLVIVTFTIIYWVIMYALYKTKTCEPWLEPNEFGDMFGFLSCLFSGLAFAGIIVTIRQQSFDLELQRNELRRANEEAAGQTKQFEEQTKQFKEQIALSQRSQEQDEFYRRLSFLKQLESEIIYKWEGRLIEVKTARAMQQSGIEAIELYYDDNIELIQKIIAKDDKLAYWISRRRLITESMLVWMSSFFSLCKDLDNNITNIKSRYYYKSILINSLSTHEKKLIFMCYELLDIDNACDILQNLKNEKLISRNILESITPSATVVNYYRALIKLNYNNAPVNEIRQWLLNQGLPNTSKI